MAAGAIRLDGDCGDRYPTRGWEPSRTNPVETAYMRSIRAWPQESKQSLRFLAAARHFLPEALDTPADLERQFAAYLRQADFQQALDLLERIGDQHSGYENESNFWKELYYAAQHMALAGHAARYEERLRQTLEMQRLQF